MKSMIDKNVILKQNYGNFKSGSIGMCTADLRNFDKDGDVFAVYFLTGEWITFKGKDIYKKFKIKD